MIDAFFSCVGGAFQRSKTLLFPVDHKIWLKLLLLYLFLGGCSGGTNVNFPNISSANQTTEEKAEKAVPSFQNAKEFLKTFWDQYKKDILQSLGLLFVIVFFCFLAFTWISSRLTMVAIQSLDSNKVSIRPHWVATADLGESLFRFHAFFLIATFASMGVSGFLVLQNTSRITAWGSKTALITAVVIGGAAILYLLFLATVWLVSRFLAVIMFQRKLFALAALKLMLQWATDNLSKACSFLCLYVLMALGIGTAISLICMMIAVMIAIPTAILGAAVVFLLKFVGASVQILAVLVGVVLAVVFIVLFSLVFAVPTETFFTYLRLELVKRELA